MIRQLEKGSRNVNDTFYAAEKKNRFAQPSVRGSGANHTGRKYVNMACRLGG